MNELTGYLELNGQIYKIKSIEDLHNFANNIGESFNELSEDDYQRMCSEEFKPQNLVTDDCQVDYSRDGKVLYNTSYKYYSGEEYKIKNGTTLIHDVALNALGLKLVFFPNSIIAIGNSSFSNNYNLAVIIFSDSIHYIGDCAFRDCYKLNFKHFPESLEYIGKESFRNTGIINVQFPKQLKKIGSRAFVNCANLRTVSFQNTVEIIGNSIFEGCTNLQEIRVPKGTIDDFKKKLPIKASILKEVE